jgi:hypothetical protein
MLLVLCDIEDIAALWFASTLRRRGLPCTVATSDLLAFARRRSLRVGAAGFQSVIELADGTVITRPALVLNRLIEPPAGAWRFAAASERAYAAAELTAFVLGWLSSLDCPVRNRPDPACLAGPAPPPLGLAAAAARAGLRCPDIAIGSCPQRHVDIVLEAAARATGLGARPVHVVCLDGDVVGPTVPADVALELHEFAATIGAAEALIGVEFLVQDDRWWFAGMTPLADLRAAPEALSDRLVALALEPTP